MIPVDPGRMVVSPHFQPANQSGSAVLAALAGRWDQAAERLAAAGTQPLTQKRLAAESGWPRRC